MNVPALALFQAVGALFLVAWCILAFIALGASWAISRVVVIGALVFVTIRAGIRRYPGLILCVAGLGGILAMLWRL